MREACSGVGGGILKNCLLMDRRLNAHARKFFVDIVTMNAQTALVDQSAGVRDLLTAEFIERLR